MGVLPRNQKAAAAWDSAAAHYERISLHLGDAIDHTILRLAPHAGERILDIGTGTGLAARRVASTGAAVVGIDLGAELIETARRLAPAIDFRVGDAEQLPFEDSSFDAVISTFGIMFAGRIKEAARETARVTRKGGRLALAWWTADSTVSKKFHLHQMFSPVAAPVPSPYHWGAREGIEELFGDAFDLKFELGDTCLRLSSGEEAWEMFEKGYGPTRTLALSLPEDRYREFRRAFIDFYEGCRTELGIAVPREYLVAVGTRR